MPATYSNFSKETSHYIMCQLHIFLSNNKSRYVVDAWDAYKHAKNLNQIPFLPKKSGYVIRPVGNSIVGAYPAIGSEIFLINIKYILMLCFRRPWDIYAWHRVNTAPFLLQQKALQEKSSREAFILFPFLPRALISLDKVGKSGWYIYVNSCLVYFSGSK